MCKSSEARHYNLILYFYLAIFTFKNYNQKTKRESGNTDLFLYVEIVNLCNGESVTSRSRDIADVTGTWCSLAERNEAILVLA